MDQVTDSFIERLTSQGYLVTQAVTVQGKSGIERALDYLVQRQQGLITYTIAVDVIANAEDPEISLQKLFAFEDKCSDCGIEHRAIIAVPHLSSVAGQFAQKDGVKVFDSTTIQAFLDRPLLDQKATTDIPSGFKAKSEVIMALKVARYQVEEGAELVGTSGTTHSFEAVAFLDDGFLISRIGLDHADGDIVDLGQVSLFDVKCGDTGIREKILVVSGKPTAAAKEFAVHHNIQLVSLDGRVESVDTGGKITPSKAFSMRSVVDQLLVVRSKPKRGDKARDKGISGSVTDPEEVEEGGELESEELAAAEYGMPFEDSVAMEMMEPGTLVEEPTVVLEPSRLDVETSAAEELLLEDLETEGESQVELDLMPPVAIEEAVDEVGVPEPQGEQPPVVEEVVEKPKVKLRRAAGPDALRLIPESIARKFTVIPLSVEDNVLHVAMVNPSDIVTMQVVERRSRMRVHAVAAEKREIEEAIDFNYKKFGQIADQIARIDTGVDMSAGVDLVAASAHAPVAAALNLVVEEAVKARASDVHFEPEGKRLRIRYRIDGVLQEVMSLPIKIHPPLTSRIKVMADLNIADHIRPQDGQFSLEVKGKGIDVRVATSPTVHGEAVVLRLLDKSVAVLDLTQLGFSPEALKKFEKLLGVPFGMILVSGPTGAGKTTTLYAALNTLDKVTRNIITVEDPVEYRFDGIKQIQVNPKAGVTFAGTMRSMMRLDPDVILVGEIRDAETATIAVKAALTGHLVMSSIHSNDAVGVVYRLLDLGVEPFLVSSVITGTVAQRMVRRVCTNCGTETKPSESEKSAYRGATGEELESYLAGSGCDMCAYTGYRGRMGLYEILTMSDNLRSVLLKGATGPEVKELAIKEGMTPLLKDGMLKVKEGMTTVSEVLRNAYSIE